MNKKEILELKRRFKKDAATFTRVCGCYVDCNHNKICKFGNTFLNFILKALKILIIYKTFEKNVKFCYNCINAKID